MSKLFTRLLLNQPEDEPLLNLTPSDLKTGEHPGLLHIFPVGGCGQFGMNITLYIYRNRVFVVDCGLQFSDAHKPGVDSLIPDLEEFIAPFGEISAYFITHGHEDHIGALPFIFPKWPAPVYANRWTRSLIERKFQRKAKPLPENFVDLENDVDHEILGVKLRAVGVNHSLPMACALSLRFGEHHVFHSGDYKLDETPVGEPSYGLDAVRQVASLQRVNVFLSDSTNATSAGFCPSEMVSAQTLQDIFSTTTSRLIATTFSSNIWRLQSLLDSAKKHGRRVIPFGQGIMGSIALAQEYGFIGNLEGLIADERDFDRLPPEQVLVLATGSQGEMGSGMHRIASGEHAHIRLGQGDGCIFSSRVIPGNEVGLYQMYDRLLRQGAHIISSRQYPGIHVSGHGYRGDIAAMIGAVSPEFFVPMHGTFSHLSACESVPSTHSKPDQKTVSIENGDLLCLDSEGLRRKGYIQPKVQYVDAFSQATAAPSEFKERFRIGEMGLATLWGCIDMAKGTWLVEPTIEVRGVPFPERINRTEWLLDTRDYLCNELLDYPNSESDEEINERARLLLRRRLADAIGKKVVVIAQILRK